MRFTNRVSVSLLAMALASQPLAAPAEETPEVVESLPEHLAYIYGAQAQQTSQASSVSQQLFANSRRWTPGDTLKVCFFGGNPVVKALVINVAREWSSYANIKLDFGPGVVGRDCAASSSGFSQVRIGFGAKGYWSAVGTDSVYILNVLQPSMNFGGFDFRYNPYQIAGASTYFTPDNVVQLASPYDRGVILHEFGHALALLHEHQNPKLGCRDQIRWAGPGNIYEYYARPPNIWDQATVDRNIGPVAAVDSDAASGIPDRDSIMMYAQPAAIFINGTASSCYTSTHTAVSVLDKALVAKLYPASAAPVSDVAFTVNGTVAGAPMQAPAVSEDRVARITQDLESDDVSVRREARRQLAIELERPGSEAELGKLLAAAKTGSYRQQLGLLVALDKTTMSANGETLKAWVNKLTPSANDATLMQYFNRVKSKANK